MLIRNVTLAQATDALKAFGLRPVIWTTCTVDNGRYQAMICDCSQMSGPVQYAIALYTGEGDLLSRFNILKGV